MREVTQRAKGHYTGVDFGYYRYSLLLAGSVPNICGQIGQLILRSSQRRLRAAVQDGRVPPAGKARLKAHFLEQDFLEEEEAAAEERRHRRAIRRIEEMAEARGRLSLCSPEDGRTAPERSTTAPIGPQGNADTQSKRMPGSRSAARTRSIFQQRTGRDAGRYRSYGRQWPSGRSLGKDD
eukprot:scaffold5176_cov132-Pinguiococcus_pyrenoidosus.AAC.1